MQKVKAVFLSQDLEYTNRFKAYIKESEYKNKISFDFFSDTDELKKGVKGSRFNLLLSEVQLTEEERTIVDSKFERLIYLSEQKEEEETIFKYQPLNDVMDILFSTYYDTNGKLLESKQQRTTSTIAFTSANGGTGKTLLSLLLAKTLSKYTYKVFYLSLEQLTSYEYYFEPTKAKSSEIFYFLKNEPHKLLSRIHDIKDTDKVTNIDFFPIHMDLSEIKSLSLLDVENLINSISTLNEYDYLIVDLDSQLSDFNSEVLKMSNEIIWTLDASETSFNKTDKIIDSDMFNFEQDYKKINFVVNKLGNNMFLGAEKFNFNIAAKVKFNTAWLNYNEREKLLEDYEVGQQLVKTLNTFQLDLEGSDEH